MNHSFKVIFNGSLGTSQVVSEHARGKGKSKTVRGTSNTVKTMKGAMALALGLALAPAVRAQSITLDGVDQGLPWTTTHETLGVGGNTVTVDGSGASWTDTASIGVGDIGTGQLNIRNGGVVHSVTAGIGDNSGNGTVNIDGAGSSWILSSTYYVGSTGTGTMNITNGGTISSQSVSIGTQGGNGTVTVDGAGSLLTTNGNTLFMGNDSSGAGTGLLTIQNGGKVSAGEVRLGFGGSGNGTVNLNSNGILETGGVQKDSPQGVLGIDGGILRAIFSESDFLRGFSAGDITIGNGGAFIDTQGFSVGTGTAGIFTGSGGLTKQGSGTLSIAGGNTWGGSTTVSAGTLRLGSYTQSSGQTLGIGAASTSSYGKLNVTGTATFNAGANLAINVAGVNTLASGQTLNGVISAGTLNATTFDVTDNSALFNFQAVLNGNTVDLNIQQASTTHSGVRDAVLAGGVSSASDAARVLDNLINAAPGGDMGTVITALGQLSTQRDVGRAAAQTLPLLTGGVAQSTLGMLGSFNSVVQNRLSNTGGGNGLVGSAGDAGSNLSGIATGEHAADRHVWAKAFGSRANQDDRNGASGFSADSWGTAFGADSEISPGTLLGVTYAYANSSVDGNTDLSGAAQHANIDSNVLGIYGSTALPNTMQLDFQADIGRSHTDGTRNINFGGLSRTATSGYATYSAHVGTGLSKDIAVTERTTFTPDVRADYTQLRAQGYSESGADALNLDVDANTTRAFVLSAGGRVRQALTEHSWLSANLGAGYDTINDRGDVVSVYAGAPGQSFTATGIDHSPWLINAGVGYTYQANSGMQVALRYDVDGRSGYLNQTASVKASWLF
jgi:outer membrane autotransporter protein